MKENIQFPALAVVVALLASGCYLLPPPDRPGPRGYMSADEDVYGRSSRLEATQKRASVTLALERMFTDPMFTEKYAEALRQAKEAGHLRPSVTVRPIEDNSGSGADGATTSQMHRELVTALRKSGKFELIDRVARSSVMNESLRAVDDGESADAIAGIGGFRSADFTLMGEITRERTGDLDRVVFHHNVNLQMIDAKSGTVFWSESIPFTKYIEVGR